MDIDISFYAAGSASIENGETTVTFQNAGNIFQAVRRSDLFGTHVGRGTRIAALDEVAGTVTLAHPWQGPSQTAAAYEIQRVPYDIGYHQALETLLLTLGNGNLQSFADLEGAAGLFPIFEGASVLGTMKLDDISVVPGALFYNRSTTTTDADPGNGTFRFNNATPANATQLFIDLIDAGGVTQTAALDSWGASTNPDVKGQLFIRLRNNSSVLYIFNVTGVTTASGYRKIAVQYVSGSGAIANTSACVLAFVRAGDKGQDGTGDVVGQGASTAGNLAAYVNAGGKLITDSGVRAADLARLSGAQTVTGRKIASAGGTGNNGVGVATGGLGEIEVRGNGTGAAMIAYHRPGSVGAYMGLDTDNAFKVGGWSMGAVARALYHQGNVLGAVSQSGGSPTGGIIERGNNSNGRYVKLADGTMICDAVISIANLGVTNAIGALFYNTTTLAWVFPAEFTGGVPSVAGGFRQASTLGFVAPQLVTGATATQFNYHLVGVQSNTSNALVLMQAIGRWF